MATADRVTKSVAVSFPVEPLPAPLLAPYTGKYHFDVLDDIKTTFSGRRWVEITMQDWLMAGTPALARLYMTPTAFLYYLPSLIMASLIDDGDTQVALECMAPAGHEHKPKGTWWPELMEIVTPNQVAAIMEYLNFVAAGRGAKNYDTTDELLDIALRLWK